MNDLAFNAILQYNTTFTFHLSPFTFHLSFHLFTFHPFAFHLLPLPFLDHFIQIILYLHPSL
jgi:hypothetical protein